MKADRYRYDDREHPDLRDLPTHAGVDKDCRGEIKSRTAEYIETMKQLQEALYADGREGIVLVLQALDAAGKDSIIKHVMSGLNPQGVMVHSFKQPGAEELSHDYLWRVVKQLPPRGSIAIFNRSHYEDVLAVQILELWKKAQWDGGTGASGIGDAPWIWLVNVDHLYWVKDGLNTGEQKIQPHGHGWSVVNNADQWFWE